MTAKIDSADVDILSGMLSGHIDFNPGLTIICGENGTLKTKLLQSLKGEQYVTASAARPQIQAISPKRNSERRAVDAAIQFMRQNSRTYETYIGEAAGQQVNDRTFSNYPSLGELFFYLYERKGNDGETPPVQHMHAVATEFNNVIGEVFPEYRLVAEWSATLSRPQIQIRKRGATLVPLHELSLGEQEVLSLITNIYASKDRYDTFLIDEPEVHLNWSLEERLFGFLDSFCDKYDKQIIAVTHSRAVFLPRFIDKVIFLVWNDQQRVIPTKEISVDQRRRIAGEAISILRLGETSKPTIFLEDSAHSVVVNALASVLGADIAITQCGPKSNVRSLYKRAKLDGGWSNSLFLEDGDNEGAPSIAGAKFLHLDKYCIENYLLDFRVISEAWSVPVQVCVHRLYECVASQREKILGKNRFLEFLWAQLREEHLTAELIGKLDGSLVVPCFAKKFDQTYEDFVASYVSCAQRMELLVEIFPNPLLTWLRSAIAV
jgi:predicted ATPase